MNLKKLLKINIIIIFALTIVFHFTYDLLPNTLFAIFFPVNESIFEHIKLIYTSVIFAGIIEYFLFHKFNIKHNNFFSSLFVSSITANISFLIIWLPIYYRIGENLILTMIVLLIAIIISQIIAYYLLNAEHNKFLNYIGIFLIILFTILFAYFTYNPMYNEFFFDPMSETYGINTYEV